MKTQLTTKELDFALLQGQAGLAFDRKCDAEAFLSGIHGIEAIAEGACLTGTQEAWGAWLARLKGRFTGTIHQIAEGVLLAEFPIEEIALLAFLCSEGIGSIGAFLGHVVT